MGRSEKDGFPHPSSRGQALHGGTGMGPRIREDNGWGWIPASVFTGTGSLRGDGDGSPHPRGQRVGGGFPLPSSRGQALCGGTGMGPRIREDNGWGWIPASVFTGTGSLREDGDWSPHPRGQRVGMDSRFRRHGDRLPAGRRGWVPASARTTGGGWDSRPRLHGGRPFCGGTGGAGMTGGGGFLHPSSRGQALCGKHAGRDGSPHPRGQRVGVDSRFRRHGDRLPARENGLGSGSCSG